MSPEEKKAFEQLTFKKKVGHIFYYYKWYMIISVCLVLFLASLIHGIVTEKETLLSMIVINSNVTALEDPPILSDYAATQKDFDPDKQQMPVEYLSLHTSDTDINDLSTRQKIMSMIAAEGIDCMMAPDDITEVYASSGAFYDLRDLISEQKLKDLEKKGYKIYRFDWYNEEENTTTPVPIGVDITDSPVIKSGFSSNSGEILPYFNLKGSSRVIYTVIINSPNKNRAVDYLQYLTAQ